MENMPWLKNYPAGVAANIDVSQYESLLTFIQECIDKYGKKEAFSNFGKSITYKQLGKYSDQFAAYLQFRGLTQGDRIAIMMPNLLQYPIALIGALKAGLIIVNTNPLYTSREMEHQFKDSEVKAIVIAENFAHNLEAIIAKTNINVVVTTSIGEMLGAFKGTLTNFVVKYVKSGVPKYSIENTATFKEALSEGKKHKVNYVETCAGDVILHQYTGGTTGVSKGAMLTNKNLIANLLQIREWIKIELSMDDLVGLSPLPSYHIFAFTANILAMMSLGAKTVLVTNPRDLKSVIKEFKNNEIHLMSGVNTLFNALVSNEEFKKLDFSKLKVVIAGGMALQTVVAEKWKTITGVVVSEGYGMTEASPVVTVNPINGDAKIGTIGLPVPSTNVRIKRDDGSIADVGEIGEIQVKGPQVMKGYYKNPEATANTIVDGWLNTGDIALMQADGYFKIVDRKKDMILVSGFNVFPNEIEEVVAKLDGVSEVAAIGVPNEKSGEIVKLFIVKSKSSLSKNDVIDHCRKNLTAYKCPKEIEFRKELPKTTVGKILRRVLKEESNQ